MLVTRRRIGAIAAAGLSSIVLSGCGGLSDSSSCGDFLNASAADQQSYVSGIWQANFGNIGSPDFSALAYGIGETCTNYGTDANLGNVASSYLAVGAAQAGG